MNDLDESFNEKFIKTYPDGSERWLRDIEPDDIRDFIRKRELEAKMEGVRKGQELESKECFKREKELLKEIEGKARLVRWGEKEFYAVPLDKLKELSNE